MSLQRILAYINSIVFWL